MNCKFIDHIYLFLFALFVLFICLCLSFIWSIFPLLKTFFSSLYFVWFIWLQSLYVLDSISLFYFLISISSYFISIVILRFVCNNFWRSLISCAFILFTIRYSEFIFIWLFFYSILSSFLHSLVFLFFSQPFHQ